MKNKENNFEDIKTPEFKNHREKQYFFRTLKRSFCRTKEVCDNEKSSRKIKNRYVAEIDEFSNDLNFLFPYYEIQITYNI